jgi:hypothetical protein
MRVKKANPLSSIRPSPHNEKPRPGGPGLRRSSTRLFRPNARGSYAGPKRRLAEPRALGGQRVECPSSIHGSWHEAIGVALFGDIPDAREGKVIADEREFILYPVPLYRRRLKIMAGGVQLASTCEWCGFRPSESPLKMRVLLQACRETANDPAIPAHGGTRWLRRVAERAPNELSWAPGRRMSVARGPLCGLQILLRVLGNGVIVVERGIMQSFSAAAERATLACAFTGLPAKAARVSTSRRATRCFAVQTVFAVRGDSNGKMDIAGTILPWLSDNRPSSD